MVEAKLDLFSLETIEKNLSIYEEQLQIDRKEFQEKFNETRHHLFDYLDRSIEQLTNLREKYQDEFDFLQRENEKTCSDNQRRYDEMMEKIRRSAEMSNSLVKEIEQFRKTFPQRPKMIDDLPQFHYQPIQFDSLIQRKDRISVKIEEKPKIVEIASDSNQIENRPVSSVSCVSSYFSSSQLRLLFKIPHEHRPTLFLLAHNPMENTFVLFSKSSRKCEHLFLPRRQFALINHRFDGDIVNLDFSTWKNSFYMIQRNPSELTFFDVDQKSYVEKEKIDLKNENLISGHVYDDQLFFLSGPSKTSMHFQIFHLDTLSLVSTNSTEKFLRDDENIQDISIIDFNVNQLNVVFLIESKKSTKHFFLNITDYQLNLIHSFDLIDAKSPLSIITTRKFVQHRNLSNTTDESTETNKNVFFCINDLESHLIHCCNAERYLTSIEINAYGITSFLDGNIALIARKDIRGLKLNEYFQ